MEYQFEQVIWFMAVGMLCAVAFYMPYKVGKIAIIIIALFMFFVNPFRMVAENISRVEGTPKFTVPDKVEGKEYESFDAWNKAEKDNLKSTNKGNKNEIHN